MATFAGGSDGQQRRRFFLIVLDGCGAGALPDAHEFGAADVGANTLAHTAEAVGGLRMPNLQRLGWGNIAPMQGVAPRPDAPAAWGRLAEISRGKDTVTGHWEMMGIHTPIPFPTYPHGFPTEIMHPFEERIGALTLGNFPASGTEVITRLGETHLETGWPIVYTSADSVFQVAAHEDPAVFGLERLYHACEIARVLLVPPHHVGRVIARPFVGTGPENFKRTENRRDYPLPPPHPNVLDHLARQNKHTHAVGKIGEIFSGQGIATSEPTTNNPDHIEALRAALSQAGPGRDADFVFANLEDFDMLYGHRNDPAGFARLLSEFDDFVGEALALLRPGDLVGITADHGNDPTTPSTDHSREYAPLLLFGPTITSPRELGVRANFGDWGASVSHWLGAGQSPGLGTSFLPLALEAKGHG